MRHIISNPEFHWCWRWCCIIACGAAYLSLPVFADDEVVNVNGYVARILNNSPREVKQALQRVEQWYEQGKLPPEPISIILHGPEVEIFFKDNYDEYKKTVDLAARLSAFGAVDVRVCEVQSLVMGRDVSNLHSFIGTVPFGPTAIKRLLDQSNYVYF